MNKLSLVSGVVCPKKKFIMGCFSASTCVFCVAILCNVGTRPSFGARKIGYIGRSGILTPTYNFVAIPAQALAQGLSSRELRSGTYSVNFWRAALSPWCQSVAPATRRISSILTQNLFALRWGARVRTLKKRRSRARWRIHRLEGGALMEAPWRWKLISSSSRPSARRIRRSVPSSPRRSRSTRRTGNRMRPSWARTLTSTSSTAAAAGLGRAESKAVATRRGAVGRSGGATTRHFWKAVMSGTSGGCQVWSRG